MPLYQVIVLAIVQGLTEFLPVSSTAHLKLVPWLFGWKDPGLAFDIALHAGILAAVLIYFYKDWIQIVGQAFGMRMGADRELSKNPKLLWLLAIGSMPVGIAGILFGKQAETAWRELQPAGRGTPLRSLSRGAALRWPIRSLSWMTAP